MGSGGCIAAGGVALPAGGSLEVAAAAVPASPATLGVDEAGEVAAAGVDSGAAAPLPPHAVSARRRNEARRMPHSARSLVDVVFSRENRPDDLHYGITGCALARA
jgi:hypothetical protein